MAESDDRQDRLRQQLQEDNGNGNGNNGADSRTRTRFDYGASAGGDDGGSSFGFGGTGSEAAEEDGGFDAGADLDVGRQMTLAGGDQQPPATTVTTLCVY